MKNLEILRQVMNNGGITIDLNDNAPQSGIMVSIEGAEAKIPIDFNTYANIDSYINETARPIIEANPNADLYVGFWLYDNLIVADVSQRFDSLHEAVKWGLIRKQKAVYSIDNQQTISLPAIQSCGTEYQRRSIADIEARKITNIW